MSETYDYTTFTFPITCGTWYRISGRGAVTDVYARLDEWQHHQKAILPELQKMIDQGWEPLGEVGPASIVLTYSKKHFTGIGEVIWAIFLIIISFGIALLFYLVPYDVVVPKEFSLPMRRRR